MSTEIVDKVPAVVIVTVAVNVVDWAKQRDAENTISQIKILRLLGLKP